jgi:8-oxo-dGTP pyrophosphatase MutT (NUDIX family)
MYAMRKCGIIMYNMDTKKYLLVYGKKSQKWGFPKGHMEKGESEEETARRELFEETGICLNQPLNSKIRFRNNIYFTVSVYSVDLLAPTTIQDTNEIECIQWFAEEDIFKLGVNQCNFGLKSWINTFLMSVHEKKACHLTTQCQQQQLSCSF